MNLTSWILKLRETIENFGMDTIFRVVSSSNEEVYLLERWGQLSQEQVRDWVKSLRSGTIGSGDENIISHLNNKAACPFDEQNLIWSRKFIQNSMSLEMHKLVQNEAQDATGPELFWLAVSKHQVANSQAVRNLVAELEEKKLKTEPQENVNTFSEKLETLCTRIEGTGDAPKDMSMLVAASFMHSTVPSFHTWAYDMFRKCNEVGGTAPAWRDVIAKAKVEYDGLVAIKQWPPLTNKKESALAALETKVESLSRKLDTKGGSYGSNKTKGCYECGSLEHMKADCPRLKNKNGGGRNSKGNGRTDAGHRSRRHTNTQDPLRTPPKEDESHTKTIEGSEHKWCGVCKRWNTGSKAHLTSEHRRRNTQNNNNSGSSGSGNHGHPSSSGGSSSPNSSGHVATLASGISSGIQTGRLVLRRPGGLIASAKISAGQRN